jgi:hypothetical protein
MNEKEAKKATKEDENGVISQKKKPNLGQMGQNKGAADEPVAAHAYPINEKNDESQLAYDAAKIRHGIY